MRPEYITSAFPIEVGRGVLTVEGYGVRVYVEHGLLTVEDGVGRERRFGSFARATSGITRCVIRGVSGTISLEALRWLHDIGAAFVQLDYDASILAASVSGLDDARLRRAQALVTPTNVRQTLVRALLISKIQGQIAVLDSFGMEVSDVMRQAADAAQTSNSVEILLRAEVQAAEAYFSAWSGVSMNFARRDHVPDHWRRFSCRRSPLSRAQRRAVDPINALLNCLYLMAEVECRIALIARGLDPGLGLFHADEPRRQSLALDVLEPVRPHVDAYVLDLLRKRTFSGKDFVELRDGACRLTNKLARELSKTMPTWAARVTPYAERLARDLVRFAKGLPPRALLVPRAEQRGRLKIRTRPLTPAIMPKTKNTVPVSQFKNACKNCGAELRIRKRVYCDTCLPGELKQIQRRSATTFRVAGQIKVAEMRARGFDPTNTPEAKRRRAVTARRQRRAGLAWQDDGLLKGTEFDRDILPGIQNVSTRTIADAMGCSISHASKVRTGRVVPHKRHWQHLARFCVDQNTSGFDPHS